MEERMDRRSFLKSTVALGAGIPLAGIPGRLAFAAGELKTRTPNTEKLGWQLAAQLYTFRSYSFYDALDMISKLGIRHLEPCFFLGLDKKRPELKTGETLPAEVRKELKERLKKYGMKMTNFYADLQNDAAGARKIFEFAKEMGAQNLVAEPPAEAFDLIEKLCQEYRINLAVHNHPKGPNSKYWTPDNVLEVCQGRSKRIGACCDTGHWVRSGLNPVQCLRKMKGRIITLHLKDVAEWGKPEARDVPLGTGKADYASVLGELRRQGFQGVLSIEYEHDSPQLVKEVGDCMKFVEETAKSFQVL